MRLKVSDHLVEHALIVFQGQAFEGGDARDNAREAMRMALEAVIKDLAALLGYDEES